ncbi:membrane-spanning 4-domains subfamily A member 4A-like [Megalops cyprinoides]|uniref:membrane-spanning 4-domains subfamily A member 4A-like n=1 Tax=Megalops cyprinoides TaxID=118141 RepID=UPI0018641E12|nr:membrane-spanning 4-domains subfamily A member 4A-like [Megalops cyprinoides]XP_036409135.1 membrane-spanning 4-domains subfamily A member 4A-like [Megalops cyprinoides]
MSSVITDDGTVIITQVYPRGKGVGAIAEPQLQHKESPIRKFLRGEPKALGAVQIMIGVFMFATGIVMSFDHAVSVYVGAPFWGGILFISSGSVSVSAEKYQTRCLVKAALVLNILGSVVAGFVFIAYCFGLLLDTFHSRSELKPGLNSIMMILSLLEMIITISTSGFACKELCSPSQSHMLIVQHVTSSQFKSQDSSDNPYKALVDVDETASVMTAPAE